MKGHVTKKVRGGELKVGDRIAPWGGRSTTICYLAPYTGPLAYLFTNGARIASFNNSHYQDEWAGPGMTIDNDATYDLLDPEKNPK